MADDYTPSMDEVRGAYGANSGDWDGDDFIPGYAKFDRAIAAHDAELRAETLREAARGFRHSADYGYRATRINATEDYLNNLAATIAEGKS